MSGGVGPSSDISLLKEEEKDVDEPHKNNNLRKGFFTFRHMNALVVIVVLSASGMVSIEDASFVIFSSIYLYLLSKFAFPLSPNYSNERKVFGKNNKILSLYVFVGAVIGVFLPIAYIFEGILEGDKQGIKAASPHVFLLASQIFMEGVAFQSGFTLPVRVFVPIFYNSRRIFTLVEWLSHEIYKVDLEYSGGSRRLFVGRVLAVANMVFWSFNLFGFLLPVYLPKAFKMYYKAKD
ncbi:hypothetical protein LIER_29727 [Lithospermum erythrorhizon]|uniref:DUF7733 domain-containing protein n=1 Tax=Lithospermum erythrorhizon TaxID=34254 RepID=A0AAV3RQC3_LITER